MVVFARLSPLGELVRASLPLATPIGIMIAIGEIGVGVGVLSGLAYRVAAAGGAALSLKVATIAAVQQAGSAAFRIPFSAPPPLPAGDPGVIVQLQTARSSRSTQSAPMPAAQSNGMPPMRSCSVPAIARRSMRPMMMP